MRVLGSVLFGGLLAGILSVGGSGPSFAEDDSWWDNPEWWNLPPPSPDLRTTTSASLPDVSKYLVAPPYGRGAAAAVLGVEKFKLQQDERPTTRPTGLLRRRQAD
jgi:hypothetical protein